jgi:tetratricopeptide (TPR) repeat protein
MVDHAKIFLLFLLGLLAGPIVSRALPQDRLMKYSSPEVRLHTDLDREQAKEIMDHIAFFAEHIDGFFKAYGIAQKKKNPLRCRLYRERSAFLETRRKANVVDRAESYFSESNNWIVAHFEGSQKRALARLLHECAHVVIRRYINNPPPWLDEGFSCYFEALEFDPHRNLVSPCNGFARLDSMRALFPGKALMDWKTFFEKQPDRFEEDIRQELFTHAMVEDFYTQAWGVIFFYLHAESEEVRTLFDRFIVGMNTGRERSQLILKDLPNREEEFEDFFDLNHREVYERFKAASALRDEQRYEEALDALLALLEDHPDHVAALRLAAETCWDAERYEGALEFWKLQLEKEPKNTFYRGRVCRALVETGLRKMDDGMIEEAVEAGIDLVRATKSQDPDGLAALAMAYHAAGEVKKALSTMRKATRFTRCPDYETYKSLEKAYSKELTDRKKKDGQRNE